MTVILRSSVRYSHLLRFLTHLSLTSRQETCHLGAGHPAPKRVLQEQQVRRQPVFIPALNDGGHSKPRCVAYRASCKPERRGCSLRPYDAPQLHITHAGIGSSFGLLIWIKRTRESVAVVAMNDATAIVDPPDPNLLLHAVTYLKLVHNVRLLCSVPARRE